MTVIFSGGSNRTETVPPPSILPRAAVRRQAIDALRQPCDKKSCAAIWLRSFCSSFCSFSLFAFLRFCFSVFVFFRFCFFRFCFSVFVFSVFGFSVFAFPVFLFSVFVLYLSFICAFRNSQFFPETFSGPASGLWLSIVSLTI